MSGYVELDARNFCREIDGKPVDLYTIANRHGMLVKATNYGAKVEQILVADRHGRRGDVALGYETIGEGPPWVITPGGRFNKESPGVRELAVALAARGNRVLVWDRPNCGESDVCFEGSSESAMQADALGKRINDSIRLGKLSDQAAAIVRLFKGSAQARINTLTFEVSGSAGAAWDGDGPIARAANNFIMRQGGTIGGGTLEMARNVIAERVLAMPRERSLDKDVPFRDVPRSRPTSR